ncbi:hypothetical protein EXIGLDRAFT_732094 [Exidia glandulosa HHB12029]|uniref:Uncharacterized protein n=1 Tax=Exidia glandulosa HHB12029 TaxID=1314781 RepID=A0A165BMT5_EXIGL|nr:hypothetical protein EXIGLDRAFT_732094 [Exidia glandulosa HHB12029]
MSITGFLLLAADVTDRSIVTTPSHSTSPRGRASSVCDSSPYTFHLAYQRLASGETFSARNMVKLAQKLKTAWKTLTGAGGPVVVAPTQQPLPSLDIISIRSSYDPDGLFWRNTPFGNREGDTDTESAHTAPTTAPAPTVSPPAPPAPPASAPALAAQAPPQLTTLPLAQSVAPAPAPSQSLAQPHSLPAPVAQQASPLPVLLSVPSMQAFTAQALPQDVTVLPGSPQLLQPVVCSSTSASPSTPAQRPLTELLIPDLFDDIAGALRWAERDGDVPSSTPSMLGTSSTPSSVEATPNANIAASDVRVPDGASTQHDIDSSVVHPHGKEVIARSPPLDTHMLADEDTEHGVSSLALSASPALAIPTVSTYADASTQDTAPSTHNDVEESGAQRVQSSQFHSYSALDELVVDAEGYLASSSPVQPDVRAASPALTVLASASPAEDVGQFASVADDSTSVDIVMSDSTDYVHDIHSPSPCEFSFDVVAQLGADVSSVVSPDSGAESSVVAVPAGLLDVTLSDGDGLLLDIARNVSPDQDAPNDPDEDAPNEYLHVDEGADSTTDPASSASPSFSSTAPARSPTSADDAPGSYSTAETGVFDIIRGISDDADSDTSDGSLPRTDDASVIAEARATTSVSLETHADASPIAVATESVDVTLGVDVEVGNAVVLNATDEADRTSTCHEALEELDDGAIASTGSAEEAASDAGQDDVAMVDATSVIYDDDDDVLRFLPHPALDSSQVHTGDLGDEMLDPSTPTLSLPVTPLASPSTTSSQGPVTPIVQVGLLPADDSLALVSRAARKRSPTPDSDEDQTPAAKRHRRLIQALGLPERLDQTSSDGLGSPVSRPSFLRRALKGRADGRPSALDRALRRRHRGRSRGSSTSGDESATEYDGDEEELDAIMEDAVPESTLASDYHAILQDVAPSLPQASEQPPREATRSPAPSSRATSPPASDTGFRLDHDIAVSADDVVKAYLKSILPAYDGEIEVGKNDIQLEILLRDADDAPFHEHLKILSPDLQDTAALAAHTGANLARAARGVKTLGLGAPFTSTEQDVVRLVGLDELHFDEDNGAMGDSLKLVSAPEVQVVVGTASNWATFKLFVEGAELTHVAVLCNAEKKMTIGYEDSDFRVRGFCNVPSNLFLRFVHLPAVINADVFTIGDTVHTRYLSALRSVGTFQAKALRINVSHPDTVRTLLGWGRELVRFPNVVLVVFCGSTRFGPWKASQATEAPAMSLREISYLLDVVLPCPRGPEVKFATTCYHS